VLRPAATGVELSLDGVEAVRAWSICDPNIKIQACDKPADICASGSFRAGGGGKRLAITLQNGSSPA
jgi:hypothetical protein